MLKRDIELVQLGNNFNNTKKKVKPYINEWSKVLIVK